MGGGSGGNRAVTGETRLVLAKQGIDRPVLLAEVEKSGDILLALCAKK